MKKLILILTLILGNELQAQTIEKKKDTLHGYFTGRGYDSTKPRYDTVRQQCIWIVDTLSGNAVCHEAYMVIKTELKSVGIGQYEGYIWWATQTIWKYYSLNWAEIDRNLIIQDYFVDKKFRVYKRKNGKIY